MTGVKNRSWVAQLLQFDRDGDAFTAPQPKDGAGRRLFGGLIAAQALGAAGATVDPAKQPQSLHLYFVRGGRFGVDVAYHVERTRDGRSFDTRRVTATQEGAVILEMIASFHVPEPGADWSAAVTPALAFEDSTPKTPRLPVAERFHIRTSPTDRSDFALPPYWIKTKDPIEDDALTRACTLTFMSDLGPVPVARPPGTELKFGVGYSASLDHAIWFHRPFWPAEWHRYEVRSLTNSDSRGLVAGALYDAAGALVASTSQEALWRV